MSTPATLRPPLDGSGLRPDPPALLVSDLTGHHESPLFLRFRRISKFNRKPFQPPPPCGHLPQIGVAIFGGGQEGASFSASRWVWSPTSQTLINIRHHSGNPRFPLSIRMPSEPSPAFSHLPQIGVATFGGGQEGAPFNTQAASPLRGWHHEFSLQVNTMGESLTRPRKC